MVQLIALTGENGGWQRLKEQWRAECAGYNEDFDGYAAGTFSVLEPLALGNEPRAGVFAFVRDGEHQAVCQANCTGLPGYVGPVLRVRFMTLSPKYDFGDHPIEEYARVLVNLFLGAVNLSYRDPFEAQHIKFHLSSPADRPFFATLGTELGQQNLFDTVDVRGAWLYVTKHQ